MQPAVFIARLIGPAFVAVGLGVLANGPFYTALILEAVHSPTLIYFSGLMALVPGLRSSTCTARGPAGRSSSPLSAG